MMLNVKCWDLLECDAKEKNALEFVQFDQKLKFNKERKMQRIRARRREE